MHKEQFLAFNHSFTQPHNRTRVVKSKDLLYYTKRGIQNP